MFLIFLCIVSTVCSILCIVSTVCNIMFIGSTVCSIMCIVSIVCSIMCIVSAVCSILCIVSTVYSIMCIVSRVCSIMCIVSTVRSIMCIVSTVFPNFKWNLTQMFVPSSQPIQDDRSHLARTKVNTWSGAMQKVKTAQHTILTQKIAMLRCLVVESCIACRFRS